MTSPYIPARAVLPKSDVDDPVDYYYRPATGWMYRRRLKMSMSLLDGKRFENILEIGYGSGILLPELSRHANHLTGLDIHSQTREVSDMLAKEGVHADLHQGDLYAMPFPDAMFDGVLCLSVFEHLTNLRGALHEIARVCRSGASVVLGFPVRNPITDAFFRAVGYNPRNLHPAGHRDILRAIAGQQELRMEKRSHFPGLLPVDGSLYCAVLLRRV